MFNTLTRFNVKTRYLMLKEHCHTQMKYLCVTAKKNYNGYCGSGLFWKRHLQKHGKHFKTTLLFSSDNEEEFNAQCLYYSELFDVVKNPNFANLVPELGTLQTENFEYYWDGLTDEEKQSLIEKRRVGQINNHWTKKGDVDAVRRKISEVRKQSAENMSDEERKLMTESARKAHSEKQKDVDFRKATGIKVSASLRKHYQNLSDEDMKKLSERNRQQRLNLSDEKKAQRKQKIQEVYATGKHDHLYERYSDERKGVDNPNAKVVLWYGEKIMFSEFKKYCKKNNISNDEVENIMSSEPNCKYLFSTTPKIYDIIVCPHCGKDSGGHKPSSLIRWHFDNCKFKKEKI